MKNYKLLLAILTGLIIVFLGTNYFKKNNSKTIFKPNTIGIDTTAVNGITITSNTAQRKEILFTKHGGGWNVSQGTIESLAKKSSIKNILNQLKDLKTERLVAKTKDKWKIYQLTDSLATKVTVKEGVSGKTTTLRLGKTKFNPPSNPYDHSGMNGSTYIRINDDPKTYSVKGILSGVFTSNFNSFRNSDVVRFDKKNITQLDYKYAGEDRFSVIKNSVWNMNATAVDSTKITNYLHTISALNNSKFADQFRAKNTPDYSLTIKGNGIDDIAVQAYKDSLDNKYFIKSSLNSNTFFESDSTGIFKTLFVDKSHFMGDQ